VVLVLVLGLPGCGCCKRQESAQPTRKNTVEKYMQTDGDIEELEEIDLDDMEGDDAEDVAEDTDMEDLDLDETDLEDLDLDDLDIDDLLKSVEMEDEYSSMDIETEEAFNWIDEQSDDELRKLYFSFNHYGIRPDQRDALSYDIEQVRQLVSEAGYSQPTIVIEGHACQEGAPAYNLALSEKRAKNVADLFVAAGVDRSFIKVVGRGQECPAVINGKVINGSREDRAPNRRVEVRVIYT